MKKFLFVFVALAILALFAPALGGSQAYACQDGKPCEGAPGQQGDNAGGGGQQDECHKHDPDGGVADCPGGNGDDGDSDHNNGGGNDADRCDDNKGDGKKCQPTQPAGEDPSLVPTPVVVSSPVTETPATEVPVIGTPVSVTPTPGGEGEDGEDGEDGKTPTITVDGIEVEFDLHPYIPAPKVLQAWHPGEKFGRHSAQEEISCPQDCCCSCGNSLTVWAPVVVAIEMAILVILAFLILVEIAFALVVLVAIKLIRG